MIIEAYFGLALISIILFVLSFNDNASPIVPILALVFMLSTGIASFNIEKSYPTSETYLCTSEYLDPDDHDVGFCNASISNFTYTTQTYTTSFPLGIMFSFFGVITLVMVLKSAFKSFGKVGYK